MSELKRDLTIKVDSSGKFIYELFNLKRTLEAIETVKAVSPELAPELLKSLEPFEINIECEGTGVRFKFHECYTV